MNLNRFYDKPNNLEHESVYQVTVYEKIIECIFVPNVVWDSMLSDGSINTRHLSHYVFMMLPSFFICWAVGCNYIV